MSEFEHDFSQFTSSPTGQANNNAHTPATNESDDFEKLDPFSAHETHDLLEHDYPEGLSSENLSKSSPKESPYDKFSSVRPLMSLGLDAEPQSLSADEDENQSPIEMVGGDMSKENKQDYEKYEDLLGFTGEIKAEKYLSEVSPVTATEPNKVEIKTGFEHDFLKDYKPQEPTAPALEEFYGDLGKSMPPTPTNTEAKPTEPSPMEEKEEVIVSTTNRVEEIGSPSNQKNITSRVLDLVYWRDPKVSGGVFGTSLLVLLSLTYCSLISVVAYLSLALLTVTLTFRVYKNVLQAVQKSGEGHPFKDYLEMDVSLPQDKVNNAVQMVVARTNSLIVELRRLFLAEDLVDSIKFGVGLWVLTYIGAWFNGMTLIILALVAAFSLPKVYETNKVQIDNYVGIANTQIKDIVEKVKSKIPVGQKAKEE